MVLGEHEVKPMTETHALKIWPAEFEAVVDGRKRFEWRKDDRSFAVGDMLRLLEWDPVFEGFTGAWCTVVVTYVLRDQFGVPPGFCVMSLSPRLVSWRDDQRLIQAEP